MLDNLVQDFGHGLRGLARDRVLALTAAATLAIAIGGNTTVFSIVKTILLRPLPDPGASSSQSGGHGTTRLRQILVVTELSVSLAGDRRRAAGPKLYQVGEY
jgi:hypothetical protein